MIKNHGFHHFGFCELKTPTTIESYKEWLEQGHQGDMSYMEDHFELKKNPNLSFPGMKSAIMITKPYSPDAKNVSTSLRIASYAQQEDYHIHFRQELLNLSQSLKNLNSNEEFLCFTDAVPFMERDFAYQAGLGWIGKNTCLIDRKEGSFFFIGEILTSIEIPKNFSNLTPDFCGNCTRCIDACPTQALEDNKVLNANKCISYLTIESKSEPQPQLRTQIGSWFFGCDICQTVCPWNEKKFGKNLMQELTLGPKISVSNEMIEELQQILLLSNKKLMLKYATTPLSRARGYGLKRNALITIGNLKIKELKAQVEETSRQWPRLTHLCEWTLSEISKIC